MRAITMPPYACSAHSLEADLGVGLNPHRVFNAPLRLHSSLKCSNCIDTLNSTQIMKRYDVIIVGAGPAGLNAALVLGRCRHSVLMFDSGQYRNSVSHAMHGFLSRDGFPPSELLRVGREQLQPYGVEIHEGEIKNVTKGEQGFELTNAQGQVFACRKLLLATGIVDNLPELEGFDELYGMSAFHCPYCDGWENRDKRIVAYARGPEIADFALTLHAYTEDLIVCTDGPAEISDEERMQLTRNKIPLIEKPVARLEGTAGQLARIVFADGELIERDSLFFHLGQKQRSQLAAQLGCKVSNEKGAKTDEKKATNIPDVFIAGDATRDVKQVIVAAAEGVKAAFEINTELRDEDYR